MYKQISLCIWKRTYNTFKAHGHNADGIPFFYLFRVQGLGLIYSGSRGFFGQAVVLFVDFVTNLLTFLFQLLDIRSVVGAVEVTDGFVGYILCFLKNGSCLFVGFPKNSLLRLIQLFILLFQFLLELFHLFFIAGNLCLFLLDGDTTLLQIGNHIFKALVFFINQFPGRLNDFIGQAQFGRYRKGITLSRYTN